MNIVEKLMAVDPVEFDRLETAELEIPRLSKKFGEPFIVKVREISSTKYAEFTGVMINGKNVDYGKVSLSQALIVCEGMIEPDLKDKNLQKHFGCATPKDLALKLFKGGDLTRISDVISELSGYGQNNEDEIKNS